jgi:antitoxin of RelE/RelB toxin-antitoxin system
MQQINYSQARADLADLYDDALDHLPTRIDRRRVDPAVLLSLQDFKVLLAEFEFSPEVLFEASSVAVWLPELAIWGRGPTFAETKADLLAEIDQLLALITADSRLRSAPNMARRMPWIYRLMFADDDAEREALLFAEPAAEIPVLAGTGD